LIINCITDKIIIIIFQSLRDFKLDYAQENNDQNLPKANLIEVCSCPRGYEGTSCQVNFRISNFKLIIFDDLFFVS
jgi:hypothetical protein